VGRLVQRQKGADCALALLYVHCQRAAIGIVDDHQAGIGQRVAGRTPGRHVAGELPGIAARLLRFAAQIERHVAPPERRHRHLGRLQRQLRASVGAEGRIHLHVGKGDAGQRQRLGLHAHGRPRACAREQQTCRHQPLTPTCHGNPFPL